MGRLSAELAQCLDVNLTPTIAKAAQQHNAVAHMKSTNALLLMLVSRPFYAGFKFD